MKQQIRIIGGQFRGKKITFPESEGLRPTPDRVRETLFNWLMNTIHSSHCLDLFAGSGALGFEACSRGAQRVVMIEKNETAYQSLLKSIANFKTHVILAKKIDALDFLKKHHEPFDVIFLDPPFAKGLIEACVQELALGSCLKKDGLLYIESESPIHLDAQHWLEVKSKKAGMVYYSLFQKQI